MSNQTAIIQSRRKLLSVVGSAATLSGMSRIFRIQSYQEKQDTDGDGIPDKRKESPEFHEFLVDTYGDDQVDPLSVGRSDLLLDVRYVGDVTVSERVKRYLVSQFRAHDIHLQWLDYPTRYDERLFTDRYGNNTRRMLWSQQGFYQREIEERLKNTAMQFVIVPGEREGPHQGDIYSPWAASVGYGNGYVNGMNFGNRAVAAERQPDWEQARLIFHELAHLALCHDADPQNTGVMGTNQELTLTDSEWKQFRRNLDNIHDTTGYDLVVRPCLWTQDFGGTGS